jgi:hypothetical protein
VPLLITLTYGFGVGARRVRRRARRADLFGQPEHGRRLIIVVFAVVVIGGMGSILGAIVTGFGLGLVEGLTGVLSRGLGHRHLHHHGHRAAAQAGRPVRAHRMTRPPKPCVDQKIVGASADAACRCCTG